jgi:hypothetical protein
MIRCLYLTQPCVYPLWFKVQWDSKNNWLWSGSPLKWETVVYLTFISFCPGEIVTCNLVTMIHMDSSTLFHPQNGKPQSKYTCVLLAMWLSNESNTANFMLVLKVEEFWVHSSSCSCWYKLNNFLWTFQGHNLEHWLVKVKAPLDDPSKLVGGGVVKLRTRISWDSIS